MEIFGKSGTRLLPLIADGAKGLAKFQEQARALGLTISTQAAKDASVLADALDTLWKVIKQAVFSIGSALAPTITELQHHIDRFVDHYNHRRPHRAHPHHATPATIYAARPKATPTGRADTDHRVRHDRVSHGSVSLRVNGQLHHIGLGRPLNGTPVILLIADLDVRIIHAATGELLRQLTIDPQRRYHGTGRPPGGPTRPRKTRQPEP